MLNAFLAEWSPVDIPLSALYKRRPASKVLRGSEQIPAHLRWSIRQFIYLCLPRHNQEVPIAILNPLPSQGEDGPLYAIPHKRFRDDFS